MTGPLIAIVGPCSAGKSTLADELRSRGFRIKEVRQEHSAVPTMWQRITNPDLLIYLDVSMQVAAAREGLSKPSSWWVEERAVRLVHARHHCDLYLNTSDRTPEEVLRKVLDFLDSIL